MYSSQDQKSLKCWNCSNLFYVNNSQEVAQCPKCFRYNKIPNDNINSINHSFPTNSNDFEKNLEINNADNIIICPFCNTQNLFRKAADELICYKCSKNIKNGFGNFFTMNNDEEQNSFDKEIIGWRIVPTQKILPPAPITPPPKYEYNSDYLLKRILKSLKKLKNSSEANTIQTPAYNPFPIPTFIPYPAMDYYANRRRSIRYIDDDYRNDRNYNINSKEIRYIPIKYEQREGKDGYKITIRKKSKRGQDILKSTIFEKIFYLK